jgi:Xaa-Pro aminopeptidase
VEGRRRTIPEPYRTRLAAFRAVLAARKLDGYLVLGRMDQFWLTGFTGEDGQVLVTPKAVMLLTDGRFEETADVEAPWARKVVRRRRTADVTAAEIKRYKLARVGYEPDQLAVRLFGELRGALGAAKLVAASEVVGPLRATKDEGEVAAIRRAVDVAQRALRKVVTWLRPGLTERQVAARLDYEMQCLGAQGPAFATIVASGPHASRPHHDPGERALAAGEPVLIDWGARVGWYVSDLTRVVWMGSIPPQIGRLHGVVRAAQQAAIAAIRPGVRAAAVDRAARKVIEAAGYGPRFTHGLGHGIGLNVHERPSLRKRVDGVLEPGMVVTVEPGIYLPGVGGVRLEDDVLVTGSGHEVLSDLPHTFSR